MFYNCEKTAKLCAQREKLMCCRSKRIITFLITAVLTFAFGFGITRVWQNLFNFESTYVKNESTDAHQTNPKINPRVKTPDRFSLKEFDGCDSENHFGGKAQRTVDRGVINAWACLVEPSYPPEAIEKQIDGEVVIEVFVDGYGVVRSAKAKSGNKLLRSAAVQAALNTKVAPTLLGGEIMNAKGYLVYNFVLSE